MALRVQRFKGMALLGLLAVGLVVALGAAACGGGSPSASPAVTEAPLPSGASVSTTTTRSRPQREYPAGGPTDPVFPPGDQAYALLTGQRCDALLQATGQWASLGVADQEGQDTIPLYAAAADVCLGHWDDADQAYAEIDLAAPEFLSHQCARDAVLAWVTAMVEERRAHPTFTPVFVPSSAPSPCDAQGNAPTGSGDGTDTSIDGDTSGSSTTTTSG